MEAKKSLKKMILSKIEEPLRRAVKPLDYLFVLRPTLFFPIWTITLAGYGAAYFFNGQLVYWDWSINLLFCLQFLFLTMLTGAIYIYNQLEDILTDRINKKVFLISENHISEGFARKYALILTIVSLVGELIISFKVAFLYLLFFLLWGILYNRKPFQWKDRPLMGIMTNIGGGALCFFAGWGMYGDLQWQALVKVIPYLFAFGAVSLLTTIPDLEGDRADNKETFAVKFGEKFTIRLSAVWVLLAMLLGKATGDPVISIPALLSLPLYIIMLFKPTLAWVFRCIRWPILFISLMVCVEFPWYFLLILFTYYLSRIYYIYRFNLEYPTFKVD